jgi:hypothetical protein
MLDRLPTELNMMVNIGFGFVLSTQMDECEVAMPPTCE